jgi:hypothetical protein
MFDNNYDNRQYTTSSQCDIKSVQYLEIPGNNYYQNSFDKAKLKFCLFYFCIFGWSRRI